MSLPDSSPIAGRSQALSQGDWRRQLTLPIVVLRVTLWPFLTTYHEVSSVPDLSR